MILFPAIDILNGECVRLLHGNFNEVTRYGKPQEIAKKWVEGGAEYLHVVDLDGAKEGRAVNFEAVREIIKCANIPVQLGGGIRTQETAERWLEAGVSRVILGTAACENPSLIGLLVGKFGAEKIVCGIDVKDGFVAVKGWLESSKKTPVELGLEMKALGVKYVVYTDISRDGALTGVNVSATTDFSNKTGLKTIASGGVSNLSDIKALKNANLYGAILGKALFEKKLSIKEALEI